MLRALRRASAGPPRRRHASVVGCPAPQRGDLLEVEGDAGAPSDRAARDATPRGARGHASCSGRPHSSGRAHLVDADGQRLLRSAAAELAPRALRAVERQLRRLVRFGIVCPEGLPAARTDAAHARALGAGEDMHVRARGRFSLHWPDDLRPRAVARLPKGVALDAGGWGSAPPVRPAGLRCFAPCCRARNAGACPSPERAGSGRSRRIRRTERDRLSARTVHRARSGCSTPDRASDTTSDCSPDRGRAPTDRQTPLGRRPVRNGAVRTIRSLR